MNLHALSNTSVSLSSPDIKRQSPRKIVVSWSSRSRRGYRRDSGYVGWRLVPFRWHWLPRDGKLARSRPPRGRATGCTWNLIFVKVSKVNWSHWQVRASARVYIYVSDDEGGHEGGHERVGGWRRGTEAESEGCSGLELCSCSCEELPLTFSAPLSLSHSLFLDVDPPFLHPRSPRYRRHSSCHWTN